ncbi:MAG: hypothetical protein M0R75_14790 [Dehalococcoidia bacterium]|nr:hypothetical protein [Dehalococcoidia bacterium]
MKAEIGSGMVKGLTYKAGTKEDDPQAIGRLVIEFDAGEADAAEIAALIGQGAKVSIETPQLAMFTRTVEFGSAVPAAEGQA